MDDTFEYSIDDLLALLQTIHTKIKSDIRYMEYARGCRDELAAYKNKHEKASMAIDTYVTRDELNKMHTEVAEFSAKLNSADVLPEVYRELHGNVPMFQFIEKLDSRDSSVSNILKVLSMTAKNLRSISVDGAHTEKSPTKFKVSEVCGKKRILSPRYVSIENCISLLTSALTLFRPQCLELSIDALLSSLPLSL